MSDADIREEPPDDNEAFANLDESLDDEDALRPGAGPEGERELDSEIIVDDAELEDLGANFDDPERMATLDGGMDDPDGSDPLRDPDLEDRHLEDRDLEDRDIDSEDDEGG